jgi:hypothetical protein
MRPKIVRTDGEVPGRPVPGAGFGMTHGSTIGCDFHDHAERDAFVDELQIAVLACRSL